MDKLRPFWILLGLMILTSLHAPIANASVTALSTDTPKVNISPESILLLRDPEGTLSIDDILTGKHSDDFKPAKRNIGMGYIKDALWLRLNVTNTWDPTKRWLLEFAPSYLDDVRVYQKQENNEWKEFRSGDRIAYADRFPAHINPLFSLSLPQGESTLYVRIRTTSTMVVLPTFFQAATFLKEVTKDTYIYGLYYGGVLLVLLFNLLSWIVNRNSIHLIFICYFGSIAAHFLAINGLQSIFLFPNNPLLAHQMVSFTLGLGSAFGFWFYSRIFYFKEYHPILYKLQFGYIGICLLLAVAAFTPFMPIISLVYMLAVVISPSSGLIASWSMLRRKGTVNYITVATYVVYISLVVITVLSVLGIQEPTKANMATSQIGNLFHFVLLYLIIFLRAHEAQRTERQKNTFMARISHDLRSPLHAIMSSGTVLQTQGTDQNSVAKVMANSQAALTLLDDLVDYSQLEQHSLALYPEPFYLHNFLEHIKHQGDEIAERKGFTFHMETPKDLPVAVVGAQDRIQQILRNLIENAFKHAATDVTLSVQSASSTKKCLLTFKVIDHGNGINDHDKRKLFEPFKQGKDSARGGAGLGLSIAMDLVKLMKGELNIEDTLEGGATFVLTIALKLTDEHNVPADEHFSVEQVFDEDFHIIIVDDNEEHREITADYLTIAGAEVHTASNSHEALECASHHKIDFLVTDHFLNSERGDDVLYALRQLKGHEKLPAILLTAASLNVKDDARTLYKQILPKPVIPMRLVSAIKNSF